MHTLPLITPELAMFPSAPFFDVAPAHFIRLLDEMRARVRAGLERDAELLESSRNAIASGRSLLSEIERDGAQSGASLQE